VTSSGTKNRVIGTESFAQKIQAAHQLVIFGETLSETFDMKLRS